MYVGDMAEKFGDRDAIVIDAHRESATYTQLDERSNQVARLCRRLGLDVGDGIAILLENAYVLIRIIHCRWIAGFEYFYDCGDRIGILIPFPSLENVWDVFCTDICFHRYTQTRYRCGRSFSNVN